MDLDIFGSTGFWKDERMACWFGLLYLEFRV